MRTKIKVKKPKTTSTTTSMIDEVEGVTYLILTTTTTLRVELSSSPSATATPTATPTATATATPVPTPTKAQSLTLQSLLIPTPYPEAYLYVSSLYPHPRDTNSLLVLKELSPLEQGKLCVFYAQLREREIVATDISLEELVALEPLATNYNTYVELELLLQKIKPMQGKKISSTQRICECFQCTTMSRVSTLPVDLDPTESL